MAVVSGLILLVIGLIVCFFGLRFYRLALALLGFVVGYYAASALLVGQSDAAQIIVSIIAGVVVALIFYALYKLSYILFGAVLGLAIGAAVGAAFNLEGVTLLIVALVLGVIGAVLGSMMANTIIRISTAFSGAAQAVGGVAALAAAFNLSLPLADPLHGGANVESTAGIVTLVLVIVLGVVGFIFQARHAEHAPEQ